MAQWYAELTALDKVFFFTAAIGGMLFFVRLVMMLLGGHHDAGADHGAFDGGDAHAFDGGDAHDFDGGDAHDFDGGDQSFDDQGHGAESAHADSDASFRVLTMQGLTAFFAFFGLAGLALHKEFAFTQIAALACAGITGYAAMFAVAKLFQLFLGLQSSGSLDMENAVGLSGKVYLTIPAGKGTGQVEIAVQDHLKVLSAMTEGGKAIKTGETVRVTRVESGNVLVVEKD